MLVSHYIAQDILESLDDHVKAEELFKKFSQRYEDDAEFNAIASLFDEYLKERREEQIKLVRQKLENLEKTRKLEGSGGTRLPFASRRSLGDSNRSR